MDHDSILMFASFLGLAMAPFWAKWWNLFLLRQKLPKVARVVCVTLLSVATMLLVFAGPWFVMMIARGTLDDNLADPRFPFGLLIVFGPGVILQIVAALSFSLNRDQISN